MNNKFRQLCVWQSTILDDATPQKFEADMSDLFGGVRFKFAEEVIEKGGRHDLLFYVHDDDIDRFAIPRLQYGIRWWEDVVKYNDGSYLYTDEVLNRYPVLW